LHLPAYDLQLSMCEGLEKSSVVLVCADDLYQNKPNCMFELREAYRKGKMILLVTLKGDVFAWASPEMKEKCDIANKIFVDMSDVAQQDWGRDDGNNMYLYSYSVLFIHHSILFIHHSVLFI
jgi:hypothetical protein